MKRSGSGAPSPPMRRTRRNSIQERRMLIFTIPNEIWNIIFQGSDIRSWRGFFVSCKEGNKLVFDHIHTLSIIIGEKGIKGSIENLQKFSYLYSLTLTGAIHSDVSNILKLPQVTSKLRELKLWGFHANENDLLFSLIGKVPTLETIDVRCWSLSVNDSLEPLSQLKCLTQLSFFSRDNPWMHLGELDKLTQLNTLNLGIYLPYKGIVLKKNYENISTLESLTNLTSLNIEGPETQLDPELFKLKDLTNLKTLSLRHTELGDNNAQHLTLFQQLSTLDLKCTRVTDITCFYLNKLSLLKNIDLRGTNITILGLKQLASLTNLSDLFVSGKQVGWNDNWEYNLITRQNLSYRYY